MSTKANVVLVCGGRDFSDREYLYQVLDELHGRHGFSTVVAGAARGADTLAADWAKSRGVGLREFPADWTTHGKSAGPIRNRQMLIEGKPQLVIAFSGGRGTANMVEQSKRAGVVVLNYTARPR